MSKLVQKQNGEDNLRDGDDDDDEDEEERVKKWVKKWGWEPGFHLFIVNHSFF